jgi:PAS domain S-box-containing protein
MENGMERPLRVLIIEDSEDDTQLLLRELRRGSYEVDFERVETAEAMQSALAQKTWDLILSDYTMPLFNAPKALEVLKASGLDLPFIISSGTIGEETAVTALKAGAHDFFIKGKFARLGPAIERELREGETRRQRKRAEKALREKERLLFEAQRIGHIGSWSYDIPGDILQYSDEMYHLLDISPQEFQHTGEAFLGLIFSLDRAAVTEWMQNIKAGRQVKELDFRVFHTSGELRYIQCTGAVEIDSTGTPARFIGTAQDITERKLAEIQIRQQIQHLTALSKIDQAIISSFDLQISLDTVLSQVITQLQVDAVDILLLDPEGNILEYAAGRGFRSMAVETAQVRVGDGHAGRAAQEHRLIKIENLRNQPDDPHRIKLLAEEDFVSYIGVPLIVKGIEKAYWRYSTAHRYILIQNGSIFLIPWLGRQRLRSRMQPCSKTCSNPTASFPRRTTPPLRVGRAPSICAIRKPKVIRSV